MICKECGYSLNKKERFCPHCGSYFIDKNDDSKGIWRGVIMVGSGTADLPKERGKSKARVQGKVPVANRKAHVWGIVACINAGILFLMNLLGIFTDGTTAVFGFPHFIFGFFAFRFSNGSKLRKFAFFGSVAAVILFIWGFSR